MAPSLAEQARRRRDSLASSTGSSDLVDDLVSTRPRGSSPATTGYAYDFMNSPTAPDYDLSASSVDFEPAQSLPDLPSAAAFGQPAPPPNNRSRARAFSFLSVHQPARGGGGVGSATPGGLSSPFSGGAYDSALDDDDDDDDRRSSSEAGDSIDGLDRTNSASRDELPLSRIGTHHTSASAGSAPNRTVYRVRFQPLDGYELAGMAASAIVVLALTATALVVAIVG